MSAEEVGWLTSSIDAWQLTRERYLRLPAEPLPLIVLFDKRCTYRVRVTDRVAIDGEEHGGSIRLPNDRTIGVRAFGITSPMHNDSSVFVALALASVWRSDPQFRLSGTIWNQYLTGAFIHEMTHARMLAATLPRLREMGPAVYPDSIRDDVVQDRFASDELFASSVARETDQLYGVALTGHPVRRAALARTALEMIQTRRARFYAGELEPWSTIEQTFLDLEGVAQWAAFTHARAAFYRRFSFFQALGFFRSGEQFWSQDEGLALFLALDALDKSWQERFFATPAVSSLDLLSRALERP